MFIPNAGMISRTRFRGARQSGNLLKYIDSLISDSACLIEKVNKSSPNTQQQNLISPEGYVPGIYNIGLADPRNNPYSEGISTLLPILIDLNTIRIMDLRVQMQFLQSQQ
jgi:hypothetical protein